MLYEVNFQNSQKNTFVKKEAPLPWTLTIDIHVNITNWKDADILWNVEDRFSIFPPATMDVDVASLLHETLKPRPKGELLSIKYLHDIKYILEQLISYVTFVLNFDN